MSPTFTSSVDGLCALASSQIVGIGIDLVSVGRIRRSVEGLGLPFVRKILVSDEISRAAAWDDVRYVSMLFAAKEACSKALGTGMSEGVGWNSIEVELPNRIRLTGGAGLRLDVLSGPDRDATILLDVFCDERLAGALVVIVATGTGNLATHGVDLSNT